MSRGALSVMGCWSSTLGAMPLSHMYPWGSWRLALLVGLATGLLRSLTTFLAVLIVTRPRGWRPDEALRLLADVYRAAGPVDSMPAKAITGFPGVSASGSGTDTAAKSPRSAPLVKSSGMPSLASSP